MTSGMHAEDFIIIDHQFRNLIRRSSAHSIHLMISAVDLARYITCTTMKGTCLVTMRWRIITHGLKLMLNFSISLTRRWPNSASIEFAHHSIILFFRFSCSHRLCHSVCNCTSYLHVRYASACVFYAT